MIFLDLDNTLVYTQYSLKPPNKTQREILVGGETYHTELREGSLHFIAACRKIAKTKILTSATREYANAHNRTLQLGFDPKDIIAREDYLYEAYQAYGKSLELHSQKNYPKSFLIDDLPPESQFALLKQAFLGIPKNQYLQIREYQGGKDPDSFQIEIQTLLNTLNTALQKPSPHAPHSKTPIS